MRFAANRALPVIFLLLLVSIARAKGVAAVIEHPGAWLMGTKVAIQFFECGNMVCGRVIWLKESLDPEGLLKHDKLNPDPALRHRQVCGPTIIWNLHPTDLNHFDDGWFYNPDDGSTYKVKMDFQSADVISARIYVGIPTIGKTKTLVRVPIGISAGWC
jgi:uncharacterized protein (DUF2147 family)